MKKPTQATRQATLFEAAMEAENSRYAIRVAELKRMQARLGLLDAFAPAVKAAGLTLDPRDIHSWNGKELWITPPVLNYTHHVKLAAVLIEQGMREVERRDFPNGDYQLELMKGRLRVSISIDRRATAAAPPGGEA